MIVKCIKNKLADFEEGDLKAALRKVIHLEEDEDIGFEINRNYVVYGLNLNFLVGNFPFYYVCENEESMYPIPVAAVFFEIVDSRLSKYWQFVFESNDDYRSELVFSEWASDKTFYEKIVDGSENEEAIFSKYKTLLENEFKGY